MKTTRLMRDGAPLRKVWCHLHDSLASPGWAPRVTVAVTTSSFVFHSPCDCCKGTFCLCTWAQFAN